MKKHFPIKSAAFLLSALIVISSGSLKAQISGNVGYSLFYSDNPYRISDGSEEFVHSYNASLSYQPFSIGPEVSYSFGLNNFKNLSDRSYNTHAFDLNYGFKFLDTAHDENVSLAAQYLLKTNTAGKAEAYKYNSYGLSGKGSFFLNENLLLITGYSYSYKNYPSLYDLTYNDNSFFTRLSAFFETKTSLHFEVSLGNRQYSVKPVTILPPQPPDFHDGGGPGMMHPPQAAQITSLKETNVTQLHTSFKVSQSLAGNTGINLYYKLNNNLDHNNSISLTEFMYSDDEDLWDDPYSFDGSDIGSVFTRIFPYDITVKLSAEYSNRRYKENLADSLGLKQRLDKRTELWFGISKDFDSLPVIESLSIGLEFMHIINNSNENYFTYKNKMAMLRLSLSF